MPCPSHAGSQCTAGTLGTWTPSAFRAFSTLREAPVVVVALANPRRLPTLMVMPRVTRFTRVTTFCIKDKDHFLLALYQLKNWDVNDTVYMINDEDDVCTFENQNKS
jgi:hypothetical protein